MLFLLQCFLNLRSQLGKNTIIRCCVVLTPLPLIHQRDVNECHQGNSMLTLLTLISLCIGIITGSDELGCPAVVFFISTIDRHLYLFVVDVQSYM